MVTFPSSVPLRRESTFSTGFSRFTFFNKPFILLFYYEVFFKNSCPYYDRYFSHCYIETRPVILRLEHN